MPLLRPLGHVWTLAEIADLPAGEDDTFDRKSGGKLQDADFRKDMGKALSAFANSGGGHIFIGVENDGTVTGCPPIHKGRQRAAEWLNHVIPGLVDYPLHAFRVDEIPAGIVEDHKERVVLIVTIDDSPSAPHQCGFDHVYYYRRGGTSVAAPHQLVDLLRLRSASAVLEVRVTRFTVFTRYETRDYAPSNVDLGVEVRNTSMRVEAKDADIWAGVSGPLLKGVSPLSKGAAVIRLLPGMTCQCGFYGKLDFETPNPEPADWTQQIAAAVPGWTITLRAASDTYAGIERQWSVADLIADGLRFSVDGEPPARQGFLGKGGPRRISRMDNHRCAESTAGGRMNRQARALARRPGRGSIRAGWTGGGQAKGAVYGFISSVRRF